MDELANKQKELVSQIQAGANQNPLVRYPNDRVTQYMTPRGDIITQANTMDIKATHRQYTRKDGTKGKQTITIMQPDENDIVIDVPGKEV